LSTIWVPRTFSFSGSCAPADDAIAIVNAATAAKAALRFMIMDPPIVICSVLDGSVASVLRRVQ
jgi:hypothetical protein